MRVIENWSGSGQVEVAESRGGVLATIDPFAGLLRVDTVPWPPPEVLQKLYASDRWRGKTPEDDESVRTVLGHYTDLQSLNSEDAITWSFFGPLIYGSEPERQHFAINLLSRLDCPKPRRVAIWLWRRVPHPEKPASNGGPEIDFCTQSDEVVIVGEAKWHSSVSKGQGTLKNRTQQDLRVAFCKGLGSRAFGDTHRWVVLGVGRGRDVLLPSSGDAVETTNLSWHDLIPLMPDQLAAPLQRYVAWKDRYSSGQKGTTTGPVVP